MSLVTVLLAASAILAVPTRYALAANDGEMSLYSTAAGAAVYLDMMLHSGNADKMETPESIQSGSGNVARISGALGYADLDAISEDTLPVAKNGEAGWTVSISSDNSKNASVYSYSAFENYGGVGQAIGAYGRYGHMLEALGIDSVVMGDGITNPVRPVIGGTLQGLFFIANGADQIMGGIVKAMQFTNPFRLFADASGNVTHDVTEGADMSVTGSGWTSGRASGTTTTTIGEETFAEDDTTIFGLPGVTEAAELIFWVYRWLYSISTFVLIPLTVVITIAGYMIGRSSFGSNSSLMPKMKRYAIRMAFLVGGIPLLAAAYTVTLDKLATSNMFETTTGMGTYDLSDVVLHSFVDFGSWAENTNLAVPSGTSFEVDDDGNPTDEMYSDLNNIVYRINAAGHPGDAYLQNTLDDYYGMDRKDGAAYDYQYGYWIKNLDGKSGSAVDVDAKRALISSLLSSYMKGEVLSGAEYEVLINTRVLGTGGKSSQELYQFLRACSNPENYADGLATIPGKEGEDVSLDVHGILAGNSVNYTMSAKTQDQLSELYDKLKKANDSGTDPTALQQEIADIIQKERDAQAAAGTPTEINLGEHYFGNGTLSSNGSGAFSYSNSSAVGLSDVGMYNYLNTKFGTTGFTVYSGAKSVNTQSHPSHYRVNLVGGGVLGPLMAGNAALLLLAVGVTGIVYGLGMLFSSIKRSFSLIISLPMAFSGAIRSIAHVLLLGMALICEIFGTIFAYMLMKSLLISVNTFIANGKVATWFTGLLGNALGSAGGLIGAIINYLIACVFLVLYIIMAIRLRLAISNALTDLVASWLNRLTDVNPGDATSSSSGFADAMVAGMASNPVGTVAGLGAMGMAGSAALTAVGRGGADEISLGGSIDSNGSVTASGGDGGDGAEGGGNMLTGAYGSSGGIEEVERKGSSPLGAAVGDGAFADASSSSDAYGASAHAGDVFGRDGANGEGVGIGGAAGAAGFGSDGADGKAGLASAFASGEGRGGEGGIGGDAGSGAIATGEAALGGAAVGGDAYGYGGDGSANIGGAQLSAAAYGEGGGDATSTGASASAFGTGGAGGSGTGGTGGDSSANAGGARLSAAAFGEGGVGEGGVGGSARGVAVGGAGHAYGGDGSVNMGGAHLSAAANAAGGSGYGQGGKGTGGNAVGGDGSEGAPGGAGGSAAGARSVAVGGAGVGYGGDGSANAGGSSSLAHAVAGEGGAGGHGGDARFRSAGAAYDRDLAGDGANMRVDARADGLRQVQVASLASTLAGTNAPGGAGGAGGAANPSDVRGVSANVDLGASTAHFGSGTLAPNARGSEHTTERIREVRGQGGTGGTTLAGAVHASSAAIGSAHAEHTSGGDVTSRGGVSAPERRRDVRGGDSSLGSAVGGAGGAGRGGMGGAPGGAGGSGVGLGGAPGAAGSGGAGGSGGASMTGSYSGGGAMEGGLRGPRVSANTGPINVNASSGSSSLGSAANSTRVAHANATSGPGAAASAGRSGAAGRGGYGGTSGASGRGGMGGTSGASGRGGMAMGQGGAAGRSGQGGRAGSSARPNPVGIGASAAPYAGAGDRAGRNRAGSAERFDRAMNGGTSKPRPKRSRGQGGTNLGDAVDHGTPAHGVDVDTLGGSDPLGRR